MKTINFFLGLTAISLLAISCGGNSETHTEEVAVDTNLASVSYKIDPAFSVVRWEGNTAGAQVYGHFGNIKITEGNLATQGNNITGGSFIVDMNTIEPLDQNFSEEHPASDLVGHLASDDFFLISSYPTASFSIKSFEGNKITGDLTIKGQTHEESVNIENVVFTEDGSTIKALGKLTFDRQKYGVAWAHYLKDVVLSDDINLEITIVAHKG